MRLPIPTPLLPVAQLSATLSYDSWDLETLLNDSRNWRVTASVEAYHNRVLDKIVALPTASQFRWTMMNFGKVDIDGAELEACFSWDKNKRWESRKDALAWNLTARYTYQRAMNRLEPYAGNQIPYIPLHSGSVTATVAWKGWRADWTSSFTGLRYSAAANTPDYEVAPFSLSDLRLEKRLETGRFGNYTIRLSLNNVFNSRYEVVQHYPMPGRNFLIGVEVSF